MELRLQSRHDVKELLQTACLGIRKSNDTRVMALVFCKVMCTYQSIYKRYLWCSRTGLRRYIFQGERVLYGPCSLKLTHPRLVFGIEMENQNRANSTQVLGAKATTYSPSILCHGENPITKAKHVRNTEYIGWVYSGKGGRLLNHKRGVPFQRNPQLEIRPERYPGLRFLISWVVAALKDWRRRGQRTNKSTVPIIIPNDTPGITSTIYARCGVRQERDTVGFETMVDLFLTDPNHTIITS